MLYQLKRHPLPMQAFFQHSLVLTYAFPRRLLEPLLPPGLTLDSYEEFGFVAVAMVQTRGLRPVPAPRCLGQDFFLTGYRIFARFQTAAGRNLRGLRILRSDTDKSLMALGGNLLTHYRYRKCRATIEENAGQLAVTIETPRGEADLAVIADIEHKPAPLPPGSIFPSLEVARHFAGPLPFTFDYEPETHSIVLIKGVRKQWDPQPVQVDVARLTFFEGEPFSSFKPRLANAFHLRNVDYSWLRGRREVLPGAKP